MSAALGTLALLDFAEPPSGGSRRSIGAIFADFDAPAPQPMAEPQPEPEPDPLPGMLDEAWHSGYAQGEQAGRAAQAQEIEAQVAATLENIAAALAASAQGASSVAEEAAAAMGETCLAALAAALPSLAGRFGAEEALRFTEALLPALADEPVVTIRVTPDLAPAIAARLAREARVEVLADEAVAAGDVIASWRGGRAQRQGDAARAAIAEALNALGLS